MQLAMRWPNESLFEASMRVLDGLVRPVLHANTQGRLVCATRVVAHGLPYSQGTFTRFLPRIYPQAPGDGYRQINKAFCE
jgi:hypothetical protein